ncbi:MAG: CotH kinase family protein, partial [Spirochaetales bacterium]|nr:CotH kinase family protein [Candidatus Physcosoma equi]
MAVEAIEDSFAYRNYGESYGNLYKPECFMIDKVTPSAFLKTEMDPELFTKDYTTLGKGERFDALGTFAQIPFETAFGTDMEVAAFRYAGDEEDRYSVFFDSTVFPLKKKARTSFIKALETLNSEDYRKAIDEDALIKYFVVHNLVNNYDSYTGIFVHNYYVREKDGRFSLIPWD